MRKLIIILFVLFNLSFAYEDIDAKTFYDIMQKEKDIIILDVRTPMEYKQDGHIPNSILIPVQELPKNVNQLEKFKNKKILVYCRSGNRSSVASRFLEQVGFKKVYNLKSGIMEWKRLNLPIEK